MDQNELEDFMRLKIYCKQLSKQLDTTEKELEVLKEEKKLAKGDLKQFKKDALVLQYVGENFKLRQKIKMLEKDVEKLIIKLNQK